MCPDKTHLKSDVKRSLSLQPKQYVISRRHNGTYPCMYREIDVKSTQVLGQEKNLVLRADLRKSFRKTSACSPAIFATLHPSSKHCEKETGQTEEDVSS